MQRVTFALDCYVREALHWAVSISGYDIKTDQDVMQGVHERRSSIPADITRSAHRAHQMPKFARIAGLEP